MMRHSLKIGFSFGTTSGIITTLGLMIGLHSGTHSQIAVLGGIFTIAIADAFSDALGIHISEESEDKHSAREIWESTLFTFISKLFFALTFVIPVLLFELTDAMWVSIAWGLVILSILSYKIAGDHKNRMHVIAEHLIVASLVIIIAHYLGDWIYVFFGA
jgi:VIT1/CCC1 family predicted Fe2+/Mn2+ transporter